MPRPACAVWAVAPARARWPGTGFSCGAIRMVFLALAGWNHETQDLLPATTSEWAPIRGERGLARVTRAGAHAARLVRKKKLAERAADGLPASWAAPRKAVGAVVAKFGGARDERAQGTYGFQAAST